MLRNADSRGGFEATADMLSITGMTLEQFADLMQGLGYRAERGEREKPRPATGAAAPAQAGAGTPDEVPPGPSEVPGQPSEPPAEPPSEAPSEPPEEGPVPTPTEQPEPPSETPDDESAAEAAAPETEVFYTFTRAGRGGRGASAPKSGGPKARQGKGRAGGKPPKDTGKDKPRASKPRKDDRIDPDNPFAAALMGLRDKT